MNKNNSKSSLFDLVMILRDRPNTCNLSPQQQLALIFLYSRNGINESYLVNQTLLAKDLKIDVRNVRALLKPLIEKKIITCDKSGRENHYSISSEYRMILSGIEENTGQNNPVFMEDSNVNTGRKHPQYTGRKHPVSAKHTIYINKKENNKNNIYLRDLELSRENTKNKNKTAGEEAICNHPPIQLDTSNSKSYQPCSSSRFSEFIKIFPKKTKYNLCLKFWQNNNLDRIADKIIDDIKIRMQTHEPWIRNLQAGTIQYLPNPYDYLFQEQYKEPIIYQATTNQEYSNGNQRYFKQRQNCLFSRLQKKIEKSYESESITLHPWSAH